MNKMRILCILKISIFVMIMIVFFVVCCKIFVPKDYYHPLDGDGNIATTAETPRIIAGFYDEAPYTIDVIACGPSHMQGGFSPMELYERYGITSYNLATSGQPIECAYYLLKEALKTQNPQIFLYDASPLFFSSTEDVRFNWREVLDAFHFNLNKLDCAVELNSVVSEESYLVGLFPLLRYHDRWKALNSKDFTDFYRNQHYYSKGYMIDSRRSADGIGSVQNMNSEAEVLMNDTQKINMVYSDGQYSYEQEESLAYDPTIPEENIAWLIKIKELCEENNVELLVTKVPCVYWPQTYSSAWTYARCEVAKAVCRDHGIPFCDILYNENSEDNVAIDWISESRDKGAHLNLLGAQKVTAKIGDYLMNNYEISARVNSVWNDDLKTYQQIRDIAYLQMEQNFTAYLQKLASDYKDKTIFITTSDDMGAGLTEENALALSRLGLKTDFSNVYRHSYLAVIESGKVSYEALSNRLLEYTGHLSEHGNAYTLVSSNHYSNPVASVIIDNKEYAINNNGINIVVYDEETQLVLDSVCFYCNASPQVCTRNIWDVYLRLMDYEYKQIENILP